MTAIIAPEMDFLRGMLFGFEGTGGTTVVCVLVSRMLSTNRDASAGAPAFLSSFSEGGGDTLTGAGAAGAGGGGSGAVGGTTGVVTIGGTGAGSSGNALVVGTGDGTG